MAYINTILQTLSEELLLHNVRYISGKAFPRKRNIREGVEGSVEILNHKLIIQISLPDYFPNYLPIIILKHPHNLGTIPHVENDGFICYVQNEGLLLDRNDPIGIINDGLNRARKILEDGISKRNIGDFRSEFEAYWIRLKNLNHINGWVEPCRNFKQIKLARFYDQKRPSVVWDNEQSLRKFYYTSNIKKYIVYNAIYIPVQLPPNILPPPNKTLSNKWIREWLYKNRTTDKKSERHLARALRSNRPPSFVLFGFPRETVGWTLLGVLYDKIGQTHPLLSDNVTEKVSPVNIIRYDRTYLMPRGGCETDLRSKHVAIIGCGSVGGYIAFELARAGVTKIELIDHDIIKMENIYRHVLGRSGNSFAKVEALKIKLEEHLPYLQITATQATAEEWLEKKTTVVSSYDLILVALGVPTVELFLNEQFRKAKNTSTVIYTWLEPYGIGGHALLSQNDKKGCLQCLYTEPQSGIYMPYNRASFAAPNQHFAKDLSGCGSVFTPYGNLDAVQTTVTTTRLALRALRGQEQDNTLVSWKGDDNIFVRAGYNTSYRYNMSLDKLRTNQTSYVVDSCIVCGSNG